MGLGTREEIQFANPALGVSVVRDVDTGMPTTGRPAGTEDRTGAETDT